MERSSRPNLETIKYHSPPLSLAPLSSGIPASTILWMAFSMSYADTAEGEGVLFRVIEPVGSAGILIPWLADRADIDSGELRRIQKCLSLKEEMILNGLAAFARHGGPVRVAVEAER